MKSIPPVMTLVMLAIFVSMVGVATAYPPPARFMSFVVGIPAIGLCLLQLGLDLYRRRAVEVADSRSELEKAQDQVARYTGRKVEFAMPSENAMFADADRDPRETVRREIAVWGWFALVKGDQTPLLVYLNNAAHEVGHVLFRPFGELTMLIMG